MRRRRKDEEDNNVNGVYHLTYTYALTVYDGEYSDEDNVTVTAVYDRSCFPE